MAIQEIHRFENRIIRKGEHLCWDIEHLFNEIKQGVHKSKKAGVNPASIGIDTWAVDFVLLDENDELLTDAVAYRDRRTDGIMEEVFQIIGKKSYMKEQAFSFKNLIRFFNYIHLGNITLSCLKRQRRF
ncbi:FGGY family carbohydrate kinase [Bacillus sp. N9]